MNELLERIKGLIERLNKASNEYYNGLTCSMSDCTWDRLFYELEVLEKKISVVFSNSPTQNAGYKVMSGLDKIKHSTPLLSLGKTKSVNDLVKFLGDREGVLSFKLDGGTECIDYKKSYLNYLATRGSSSTNEGQDITHNALAIIGIPSDLYIDNIQVIGEGIMYKSKFDEINSKLLDIDKYANARNLANATASMFDSKRVAERDIRFIAFGTLEHDKFKTKIEELCVLMENGFTVVEHVLVTKDNLVAEVERMTAMRGELNYDIDGLVLAHNDMEYGRSLGKTNHHFKNAIAYKFEDGRVETKVTKIIEDVGKSAQISFKAKFNTVVIEGSDVSFATLHNPSIINGLGIGVGAIVTAYKANMIVPAIDEVIVDPETVYKFDYKCPSCGSKAIHHINADGSKSENVYCSDPENCDRVIIRKLTHFCSTEAMDIRGLSEETIKTIYNSFDPKTLHGIETIYDLPFNKDILMLLDRFGKKKVDKFCDAIEKSKTMPLNRVIYGLAIPSVGRTASKKIAKAYGSMRSIIDTSTYADVSKLVGVSVAESFFDSFADRNFVEKIEHMLSIGLTMVQEVKEVNKDTKITGLTFCVTGKVHTFENRDALKAKIEEYGGINQSGVSKTTNFLINNDIASVTGKNAKAKKLGVNIITEKQFLEIING